MAKTKKGYLFAIVFSAVGGSLLAIQYGVVQNEKDRVNLAAVLVQAFITFVTLLIPALAITYWYYKLKSNNPIIRHLEKIYGKDFEGKPVKFTDVFRFQWETAYLFAGKPDQDLISKTIGFQYSARVEKDEHHLLLFVYNKGVVENFFFYDSIFEFDDNELPNVYKISNTESEFTIWKSTDGKYRLKRAKKESK